MYALLLLSFECSWAKTFVDRLVVVHNNNGISQEAADWLLSLLHPMKQICGICMYLPIRRVGYAKIYTFMFWFNLVFSGVTLVLASPSSSNPYMILGFLIVHTCLTGAVQSAGFHLAMSDMVLEMKRKHAVQGRLDEPSLAGLFMGANALLCKPMESVLPIIAAWCLEKTDFATNNNNNNHDSSSPEKTRQVLFYLLVLPVLICSIFQLVSWRKYNLHSERTEMMREELQELTSSLDDETSARAVELVA